MFFRISVGDIVFKLRLMLTETLIVFEINSRFSVLSGFTDIVRLHNYHPGKISSMQDSIVENAEEAHLLHHSHAYNSRIFEFYEFKKSAKFRDCLLFSLSIKFIVTQ